jgi:hypothetical protein
MIHTARGVEFFDEIQNVRGRRQALGCEFGDRLCRPVVDHAMMSGAMQPPRNIGPHPAKTNDAQLHCQSFSIRHGFLPIYTLMR